MEFKNSFVAFIDILGFKKIIFEKNKVEEIVTKVRLAIEESQKFSSNLKIIPNVKITQNLFSDSIVLSVPIDENIYENYKRLRLLLHSIEKFQFMCAIDNIWIRGGVSWGELSTDNNVVGGGLLRAYQIEQIAQFPRVILDPRIISEFFKNAGPDNSDELLKNINLAFGVPEYSAKFLFSFRKDTVNPLHGYFQEDVSFFIHYLNSFYDSKTSDDDRLKIVNNLQKNIYQEYDPKIISKYRWVVNYLYCIKPSDFDPTSISVINLSKI